MKKEIDLLDRLHDEKLYDISAGAFCGVLVTKSVMVRAVKIMNRANSELRELLRDNRNDIHASHWTMTDSKDKASYIKYIDDSYEDSDLDNRIELFTIREVKSPHDVYHVKDYKEADSIAQLVEDQIKGENNGSNNRN